MKLVTLALRPLTVGRSASKQWEKRMNILHAQGPVHTDCSAVLISEWMHFMLSMNLSGFWRRGLGALDMLEPFGPAWGQKLRSLPIFRRSADGNERHEIWTNEISLNVSSQVSFLHTFLAFLQSMLFLIVFLQHGFCDLQDLLKRIDGVAAWSWKPVVKPCFLKNHIFFRYIYFVWDILCGIFLLHLRGLWNGAGIVGWPGCAEAWEWFWIWSLAHPFLYALRLVGWIKTWCRCGQGVSNLLSPNWSRMATRHWTQWKLSHAKLSAYTPEAGECRLKCSVLASSP